MNQFPFYELSGSPEEIGKSAGNQFGERIRDNYEFYEQFFADFLKIKKDDIVALEKLRAELKKLSVSFADSTKKYFPKIDAEICAIAKAARLEEWQLYTLNARTEIYRKLAQEKVKDQPGECTALYFPDSYLLGQNWDWHPRLEELCVVTKIINESGRSFIMLTEPGIVGKIGLNSDGLGVCLNILFADCEIKGIPVHIILRAVLECSTTAEAKALIETLPRGTTSNLLIADTSGTAIDLELQGDKIISVNLENGELIHTNHFLNEIESATATLPGSIYRLNRAHNLYREFASQGISGMQKILSDKENNEFPICRSYSMGLDFMVGTVASVIMDLKAGQLRIFKGQPVADSQWTVYSI